MPSSQTNTAGVQATPISALKRRVAGERNWKMEIEEVLASQRLIIAKLRAIRHLHPRHVETLELVAEATEDIAEGIIKLTELYHYKSEEPANGSS